MCNAARRRPLELRGPGDRRGEGGGVCSWQADDVEGKRSRTEAKTYRIVRLGALACGQPLLCDTEWC